MSGKLSFKSCSLSYAEASVAVEILKRDSQKSSCVEWRVGGKFFYSTSQVKVFDALEFESRRTAIYRTAVAGGTNDKCGGLALSTPEHLAPVFLMWPGRSFVVDVPVEGDASSVPEVPLMDGSALPFFLALRREVGVPEETLFYDAPVNLQWDLRNAPD